MALEEVEGVVLEVFMPINNVEQVVLLVLVMEPMQILMEPMLIFMVVVEVGGVRLTFPLQLVATAALVL